MIITGGKKEGAGEKQRKGKRREKGGKEDTKDLLEALIHSSS